MRGARRRPRPLYVAHGPEQGEEPGPALVGGQGDGGGGRGECRHWGGGVLVPAAATPRAGRSSDGRVVMVLGRHHQHGSRLARC